jgi:hypothetical protein
VVRGCERDWRGGGVGNSSTLILYGSSSIVGNAAGSTGGGVWTTIGGNVHDNSPDDCYPKLLARHAHLARPLVFSLRCSEGRRGVQLLATGHRLLA